MVSKGAARQNYVASFGKTICKKQRPRRNKKGGMPRFKIPKRNDMGFGCVFGATPAVESASLRVKFFNFLDGAPIKVAPWFPG
jgi:hypothetical protein